MRIEFEITFTDGGMSWILINLSCIIMQRKNYVQKLLKFDSEYWILDKVLLDCEKSPPCEAYLKLSWQNYVATYNRAEVNNEPFHLWHGNLGAGDM